MFAIVEIKGSQYKVQENQRVFVPKMKEEEGAKITFDKVLMTSSGDGAFKVGAPSLDVKIEATVIGHVKDDKVVIFKKKRRKGYKVLRGFRHQYTEVQINKIA